MPSENMIARRPWLMKFILFVLALVLGVLVIEVVFRIIGHDFSGQVQGRLSIPIYYRHPTEAVGEIFFRRPGPDVWKGKVIRPGFKGAGGLDDVYNDERDVVITYDREGFRNKDDLNDWDIVIIGDSFVELGYLPYDDLFTAQVGRLLGKRVKNASSVFSGPLTYLFYLNNYGKSPSTKHAVMVFFEGNDIEEMMTEFEQLMKFRATGEREYRIIIKQTSFVKAAYDTILNLKNFRPRPKTYFQNAFYQFGNTEIPVTVSYAPRNKNELHELETELLEDVFGKWAESSRSLGMRPWVVYMPSKERVLHGYLRFTENTPWNLTGWKPSDLPEYVKELSSRHGINFIDVTDALVKETKRGVLTYNSIWDTHLNREGSRVVAETIANSMIHNLD